MKILFTGKNHSQGLKALDPSSLAGAAKSLGHELVQSIDDAPDVLICVDFHKSSLPIVKKANFLGIRTVLVANEPEVVIPEHSQVRVLKHFDTVLRVGRPDGMDPLLWPQTWLPISENKDRLHRAVLVNSDKWSYIKGQHYWLRASASSELENLDVFGVGWDRPLIIRFAHRIFEFWRTLYSQTLPSFQGLSKILTKPRAYLGSVSDKNLAMSRYKVALVVENSSEFMTEKLFDAWFAGCIPVYLGPSPECFGIPSNLAVQLQEHSLSALKNGIETALSREPEIFRDELRAYLSSEEAQKWKSEVALGRIIGVALQS